MSRTFRNRAITLPQYLGNRVDNMSDEKINKNLYRYYTDNMFKLKRCLCYFCAMQHNHKNKKRQLAADINYPLADLSYE